MTMRTFVFSAAVAVATLSIGPVYAESEMSHHHEMLRHHHHVTRHHGLKTHCSGRSHGTGYHGCGTATGGPVGGLPSKN